MKMWFVFHIFSIVNVNLVIIIMKRIKPSGAQLKKLKAETVIKKVSILNTFFTLISYFLEF